MSDVSMSDQEEKPVKQRYDKYELNFNVTALTEMCHIIVMSDSVLQTEIPVIICNIYLFGVIC